MGEPGEKGPKGSKGAKGEVGQEGPKGAAGARVSILEHIVSKVDCICRETKVLLGQLEELEHLVILGLKDHRDIMDCLGKMGKE